jgi:cytochrome c oxidase subunit 3
MFFYTLLVVESLLVHAWEWKTLSKENMVLLKQRGGSLLQFVDKDGKRVALAEFTATLPEVREQLREIKQNGLWKKGLPSYSL